MSCNRDVDGDYELSEVLEAAETNLHHTLEDHFGIIIDGPNVSCNASRLDPGSDRVFVWQVTGETTDHCQTFVDRLEAMHG